ncbi:MAG: hypothetical protein AB3X44_15340 [Leptothrix sp. (in: b-proteobacteria)]
MSTALNRRLLALEAAQTPPEGPSVIFISFLGPKGAAADDDSIQLAYIIGTPARVGGHQLKREAGESAAAFKARVEAAR